MHYLELNRVLVFENLFELSSPHTHGPGANNSCKIIIANTIKRTAETQQPTLGNYSMNLAVNQMKYHW